MEYKSNNLSLRTVETEQRGDASAAGEAEEELGCVEAQINSGVPAPDPSEVSRRPRDSRDTSNVQL